MDEKKMDTVPQLSLDTQEVPTLTLDLEAAVDQPFTPKPEPPQHAVFDESSLTEAERKMVNDFAEKIQISNSNLVLQYGSAVNGHRSAPYLLKSYRKRFRSRSSSGMSAAPP